MVLNQTEINNLCINNLFHEYLQSRGTNFWDNLYIIKRTLHGGLKIWILFSRGKTIFYSLAALVRKILFCHSKIKFISSRHRVISSMHAPYTNCSCRSSYEEDIKQCKFHQQGALSIKTQQSWPNFFKFQSVSILAICCNRRHEIPINMVLNNNNRLLFSA